MLGVSSTTLGVVAAIILVVAAGIAAVIFNSAPEEQPLVSESPRPALSFEIELARSALEELGRIERVYGMENADSVMHNQLYYELLTLPSCVSPKTVGKGTWAVKREILKYYPDLRT